MYQDDDDEEKKILKNIYICIVIYDEYESTSI
jgi:hypothetical protein